MSSWYQANRGEKLDLVWRNRKKISQIINDYLCLPFFLLIILWFLDLNDKQDIPERIFKHVEIVLAHLLAETIKVVSWASLRYI
jgi:hypothetical protein